MYIAMYVYTVMRNLNFIHVMHLRIKVATKFRIMMFADVELINPLVISLYNVYTIATVNHACKYNNHVTHTYIYS